MIVPCARYCFVWLDGTEVVVVMVVVGAEEEEEEVPLLYRSRTAAMDTAMAYIMVVNRRDHCGPYRSNILRCHVNNNIEQGLTHPIAKVIITVDDDDADDDDIDENVCVEVNTAPIADRANSYAPK